MAHMTRMAEKKVDDGTVVIYRDAAHAYYVGKTPDANLEKFPMGAFKSLEAARKWADQHWKDGSWSDMRNGTR